jgi:hypothetical protein
MLKANFVYQKHADEILGNLEIPYQEWTDGSYNVEWRIEVVELSNEQRKEIKKEFGLKDKDLKTDYIIFFN